MAFFYVADLSPPQVTVSVVSHGQGGLVTPLLEDLADCPDVAGVVLTYNLAEPDIVCPEGLKARLRVVRNTHPLGFAANHNAAFCHCTTRFFAILNPDLRLPEDPFPALLACLSHTDAAIAAPAVVNAAGEIEDNARVFPTIVGLVLKMAGIADGRISYRRGDPPLKPDWVAGMFLLADSGDFRAVGGFDAGFHLYYEDVDLCARLRKQGRGIILCPSVCVIHEARRASRRRLRYLLWHLSSAVRYFAKQLTS